MEKATKILPMEPWVLTISNQQIVKNHKREIQQALNKPPAQKYWQSKLQLVSPTLNELDTEAMEKALRETHPTRRWWATKQMTSQFAHGQNMMQCGQHIMAQCPRCQAAVEDKIHIIHCLVPSAQIQWTLSLQSLKQWLTEQGLDTQLCKQLIALLNDWANATESHKLPNMEYCAEQIRIGWDRMMDRWISHKWRDHQEHIWKTIRSWKSSLQWMAVPIQKMWDMSWDMWDHQIKELHNGDISRQLILHSAMDTKIAILHRGGAQQLPRDALKLLRTPKETVLSYSLASKQFWLESVKAAQQCRIHLQ